MAYNPFNWFRKHQRTIFAGLTIAIMIVFIAQFGQGDVFSRATKWFDAGRERGPTVATLNGRRVSEGELARVAANRKLATEFLVGNEVRGGVLHQGHQLALDAMLNKKLKAEVGADNPLFGLRDIVQKIQMNRMMLRNLQDQVRKQQTLGGLNPQMAQFYQMQQEQMFRRSIEDVLGALTGQQARAEDAGTSLNEIARREKVAKDPELLDTVMNVGSLLGFELWELSRRREDFYLGGTPQTDSLLDFVLWQQQADKLGISLSDADLAKEITRDAGGAELFDLTKTSLERDKKVTDFLILSRRESGRVLAADVIAALKEEYRVAMAQSLLAGIEPGGRTWRSLLGGASGPAVGTPREFLDFVRESRTTMRVKMMPVSVEPFVAEVKAEPSEDVLKKLFEKNKEREPNPAVRDPGFKEPRRVRGEYAIGSIDTPYFREFGSKRAGYLLEMAEPWRRAKMVLLAPALSPLGAGPLGQALAAAGPVVTDPVQAEYQAYLKTTSGWLGGGDDLDSSFSRDREKQLQLASALRPEALSQAITAQGGPFVQLATLYMVGTNRDVHGALAFTKARLLGAASASATPGLGGPLAAAALAVPFAPEVLPVETLRPTILAALQERLARTELGEKFAALREEIDKLKGKADVAPDVLAAKAKELHLTLHRMPAAISGAALLEAVKRPKEDLGLKPMQEAMNRIEGRENKLEDVASRFFGLGQGTYELTPSSVIPNERMLSARWQDNSTAERSSAIMFWRSEDLPARMRSYAEARSDVLTAWRRSQALDLARRKALEIRDRINKEKLSPADAARVLAEAKTGELFELDNVALRVAPKEVRPEARTEYRPFEVPESLESALPYPPEDLPKVLQEMKRPGEAMVLLDRPARTFYVAVLEARDEPTVAEFAEKVYKRSPFRDPLYDLFVAQKRGEYRNAVVEQLRKESGAKLDSKNRYELPEGMRKAFGGRGDGDE